MCGPIVLAVSGTGTLTAPEPFPGLAALLAGVYGNDALGALNTADSNYGNYKIIESAVAKAKDNLAGLTPQKLSQAVYDAVPDGAYARGAGGDLRDLTKPERKSSRRSLRQRAPGSPREHGHAM